MTDTAAQSKINDWMTSNYGVAPVSGTSALTAGTGMLAAASPATAAPPAAAATTTAATPKTDIASWYRSTLGRDGDAAGIAFWQSALDSGRDAQGLYADFEKAATANKESVKQPTTWEAANNYTGPQSSDKSSVADDWGRNVLGRNLTGAEQVQWSSAINSAKTAGDAQKVYSDFLTSMGGQVRNPLDFASASQISTALPNQQYMPYTIDKSQISHRTIDKPTETVQGQIASITAADGPVMQQARAEAMRSAADRGMLNSSMAASGGEDAVIRAATGIATTDSGYYNHASDYNSAADNQALMYNTQAQNAFLSQTQSIDAQAAQQQVSLGSQAALQTQQINANATSQDKTLASQRETAALQDATTRWQAEMTTANSRYNTDAAYKQQMDSQKQSLANNIIANMDLSPDRKAAMLEALGMGSSAKKNADGSIAAGTGLAGAVYVIGSTAADLQSGGSSSGGTYNGNGTGAGSTWGPDSPGYG